MPPLTSICLTARSIVLSSWCPLPWMDNILVLTLLPSSELTEHRGIAIAAFPHAALSYRGYIKALTFIHSFIHREHVTALHVFICNKQLTIVVWPWLCQRAVVNTFMLNVLCRTFSRSISCHPVGQVVNVLASDPWDHEFVSAHSQFFLKIAENYFSIFLFFTLKMKEPEDRPAQKF
jgi:hypothetical protein